MTFNITGNISKTEIGLISIILITTSGAAITLGKNDIIAVSFFMLTLLCVFVYIIIYLTNFFNKMSIDKKLSLLFETECIYQACPSDEFRKTLVSIYESFQLWAIKEKEYELADALKDKIKNLKQ
ncbi:MAG: hypothetical protein WCE94_02240 [Candidatus Methanoperedens sp.]